MRPARLIPLTLLIPIVLAVALGPAAPAPGGAAAQQTYRLEDQGWDEVDAPDPDSPEGELVAIRRQLAAGEVGDAKEAADDWIKAHPEHPRLVEAYLVRGDAKLARRRYFDALFDYEAVIRSFPASPEYHEALERELTIARLFASGVKRRFLGMRILSAYGEAEEIFIRTQERAPGSELGEEASLALADHYYGRGEMTNAADAYDLFLQNYPKSDRREHAMLRLIQANLARFKGPRFDATGLIEAAERLRAFQDAYPGAAERIGAEALFVRIDESLAAKALQQGRWYEKRDEPVSAAYLYRRIVDDHPATGAARRALARLDAMGRSYGKATAEAEATPADGEPDS